jgi:hypothetical protein
MNHHLDGRLRKLEQKQAEELCRDREIRVIWVTANSSRGPGLWHESELTPEERTSLLCLVAQRTPVAVESTKKDARPTCSVEDKEEQEEQQGQQEQQEQQEQ